FLLFDDLGYGQPTCYRSDSEFRTPSLDRLASEGMRFTDAHSAAAVCTPTRYGVLTGRYPSRIGQFGVLTTYSPPIIPKTRMTVARLLHDQGYHTACIGKWHLGLNWDGKPGNENAIPVGTPFRDGPLALGFDHFWGFTHARNIGTVLAQEQVAENREAVDVQPLLTQKAVDYIGERAKSDQPFFLYLPVCPPHTPIVPAAEFVGQGGVNGNKKDSDYGDWLYQGDSILGRVMETLESHGLADNTLLIASSDNGAERRAYEPLRGSKRSIYEGGHRVPFVARWPGHIQPGATCAATICLNDLFATCADVIDTPVPPDAAEDSVSLLPLLTGTAELTRESTIHQSSSGDLAIRQGSSKLVFLKDGTRELYNLETDLREDSSVLSAHEEVATKLSDRLQQLIDNGRTTPGPTQTNDAEITLEGSGGKRKKKNRQRQ
ncbi:MAG: arylsulfatase, partial [Planctomycetaceae bacterium]|nr:arylsulfatase [Planctomycetaceae bacterium]